MGAAAGTDSPRRPGRGQAKDLGAGLSDSAPARAGRAIRPAHAAERRLDARRAVLLPARGPAASEPSVRRFAAADPRGRLLLRSGLKKLVRTLAPDGNYHLTKLGKAFFKEKYTEWLAHVPVRIRGRRKNGRGYERLDYLPVTSLNVGLQRQNDGLSEGQVARNVKQAVLQKLGSPSEDDAITELSEKFYFLHGAREWTLSSQTTQHVDNRALVETSLRQPLGALREVSYQLFKGDEILASAFERRDDKLCAARQLAELLRLPLEEVLSDFDTICDRGWQERGVTPEEIRKFCVWRGAPMLFVNCQAQLLDSYQPAVKEARAVAFTAWQGHAFFYKNARSSLRLRAGEADCVICELPEEAEVLQAWMERFGLKYRGQRLAGATNEVFLHLLQAQRAAPASCAVRPSRSAPASSTTWCR